MPFTGSHPILALPLRRWGLPATALVIGSMSPDVPYYLPGRPYWSTHTPLGLVTVDVVIGVVLWLVWVALLRNWVLALAPAGLRARTGPMPPIRDVLTDLRGTGRVVVALFLGAVTHVLWDEFTHVGRWGDRNIALLHAQYGPMPGWHWAQYLCGAFGLGALAWCAWRWWRRTPARHPAVPARHRWVWPVVGIVTGVAAAWSVDPGMSFRRATFVAITGGLGAGVGVVLGLALVGALVAFRREIALTRD